MHELSDGSFHARLWNSSRESELISMHAVLSKLIHGVNLLGVGCLVTTGFQHTDRYQESIMNQNL
jgi:hypothetical protein